MTLRTKLVFSAKSFDSFLDEESDWPSDVFDDVFEEDDSEDEDDEDEDEEAESEENDDETEDAESNSETDKKKKDNSGNLILNLPFLPGKSYFLMQGYNGSFSHNGCMQYALDFDMPEGTPVVSAAAGRVMGVKEDSNRGGADSSFIGDGNSITIDHGSQVFGFYLHLCQNCVDVEVGDVVKAGDVIGRSGNTGYSTKPHLHFALYSWDTNCSVPNGFAEVKETNGIPLQGKTYTAVHSSDASESFTSSRLGALAFAKNGVILNQGLPLVLQKSQTYAISGRTTDHKKLVAVFLLRNKKWVDGVTAKPGKNGAFSMNFKPSEKLANGGYGLAFATSDENYFYSDFSSSVLVDD